MRAEQQIPLFLWVAAALVAHALGGGGVTHVATRLEETMDIRSFASAVRAQARFVGPVEVSFEEAPAENEDTHPEDEHPVEDSDDALPTEEDPEKDSDSPKDEDLDIEKEEPEEQKKEEEADQEKTPEQKEQEKEKPPELMLAERPKPPVQPNRRVSVDQHVQDKNQDDNPDAEFAGEHANRVEEQTQARITSTDQNAQDPNAGSTFDGSLPDPGNSEDSRVAQSDENDHPDRRGPGATADSVERRAAMARSSAPKAGGTPPSPTTPSQRPAQTAQEAKAHTEARDAMAETHHHRSGAWALQRAQEGHAAQDPQKARQARDKLRALQKQLQQKKNEHVFGYGSGATTDNGVHLNLTPEMAQAVIGHDELDNLRAEVGKRRLSQHRGSWKNLGLDRWRGAIENYVATVKPGNQTALNTARVPFARYLNQIHQQLHEIFAHGFLGHLDQLPAKHPLNNQDMSTHIEIALSREDGRVVKMGVTKSSGVTAFDVGALESVSKAAPYGPPPESIVSSDGNVYLHWEFHRNRNYACSTYFAHPYILNTGQKSAPPRVAPPPPPDEREEKKPNERSGALEKSNEHERNGESG